MKKKQVSDLGAYQQHVEFTRIGNEAVRRAQEESRRLGVANVYSRNGRLYWELPNGEITFEDPYSSSNDSKIRR